MDSLAKQDGVCKHYGNFILDDCAGCSETLSCTLISILDCLRSKNNSLKAPNKIINFDRFLIKNNEAAEEDGEKIYYLDKIDVLIEEREEITKRKDEAISLEEKKALIKEIKAVTSEIDRYKKLIEEHDQQQQ